MQAAQLQWQRFGGGQDRLRDRAGALGLTLVAYMLLVAMLIAFGGSPLVRHKASEALDTILIAPPKPPPAPMQPPARREGGSPRLLRVAPEPALRPDLMAPAAIAPVVDLPKMEFAEEGPASAASGTANAGGAGSGTGGMGNGTGNQSGSGGVKIYRAEWQKLNTDAELRRKLPRNAPANGGVGEIVCRAAPNFKVSDCKLWGESPKGSGYGQAVLDIANIFRVKPPMVNGKPQIGAWVLISIHYTDFRPPLY